MPPALPPVPPNVITAGSRLATIQVTSGSPPAPLTLVRECDDQTAMRRALAEFAMLQAQIGAATLPPAARNGGLHRTFYETSDWEQVAAGQIPYASVDDAAGYAYDWAGLAPDPTTAERVPGTPYWIAVTGSVNAEIGITITATDWRQRDQILAAIKQPFMAAEDFNGIRLRLPFYYNAVARFTLETGVIAQGERDDQRLREATLLVQAELPLVSVYQLVESHLLRVDVATIAPDEVCLTATAGPATLVVG